MSNKKWIVFVFLLIVGAMLLSAFDTPLPGVVEPEIGEVHAEDETPEVTGPDRGDILEELDTAIENIKANPTSEEARLELVDLLFKAGYFKDAQANLAPLADSPTAPIEALTLMGDSSIY